MRCLIFSISIILLLSSCDGAEPGKTLAPEQIEKLMEDFRSPSDDTYGKSVSELNKAPGQAIPLYAEVLESDPSPDMRRRAAIALGMTEDGRAVEPLIEALGDRDLGVVMMAVRYLGKIGDERAVEPLIRTLAVDNSGVRQWTANALESITGEDFDDDYSKWKAWYDKSN